MALILLVAVTALIAGTAALRSGLAQQPAQQQPPPAPAAGKGKAAKSAKPGGGAAASAAGAQDGAGRSKSAGSPAAAAPRAASPGQPAAGSPLGSPPPDMGNIDQILEGDEEVLAGANGFTYDPGNRRDPFKSLLIAPDRPEFRGPRPEGIPGLLIDEIDLKGIFRTARGYVAQVNASNQKKSYLLKEGDQLYDGDVVSIGKNEVVFKQIVQDPSALKPFREIVKSLTAPQ
jgi:hypothetical protein